MENTTPPPTHVAPTPPPTHVAPTPGKRILIIDDDRYNRDFYQELLQDAGYSVDTVENGQQGIEKMESTDHYDLVLLDIVMPVKDGMETLTFLDGRKDIKAKHGPIYMLSALGQESVLENAKKLGSTGYIVKTDVTPEAFQRKVEEILKTPFTPPSV
ncbi:MAG: response regulator [Candidatus Woesebacteria bacterium]